MPPRKTKEERANDVRGVWTPGDSLSTLAAKLNTTRSSISGIYMRNPLLKISHPLQSISVQKEAGKPTQTRNTFEQRATRLAALSEVRQKPAPEVSDKPGRYDMMTLPPHGCKWPHGDRVITFCGAHRDDTGPYCTEHAKRAYTPRAVILARRKANR